MITRLKLAFGSNLKAQPLTFSPGPVTVFVGPNNAGKSLILREIYSALFDQPQSSVYFGDVPGRIAPERRSIVRELHASQPSWAEIRPSFEQKDRMGTVFMGNLLEQQQSEGHIFPSFVISGIEQQNNAESLNHARMLVRRKQVALLGGRERLSLVDSKPAGNMKQAPSNHLEALFHDNIKRRRLSQMTHEAFGFHFVIDPTNTSNLSVAFSRDLPANPDDERSLSHEAISFFSSALPVDMTSDGVKAYTGILAAVLSSELKVLLIDEPDAFLHPPLARRLGSTLTSLAFERQGHVFAATHSSDFLMGCVEAGKPVNIVRLTHTEGTGTAKLLEAGRVAELMRDPLLRSTRLLDALFHHGAVVCEADKDRAFYEEINYRLAADGRSSARDSILLNAQNKQTVRRIISALREMGVPAAAIVDLDIVQKKDHNDLRDLMAAASVPDGLIKTYGQLRGEVEAAFTTHNLKPKRAGIGALDETEIDTAQKSLSSLAEYGIFVPGVGELEKWLSSLSVPSKKSRAETRLVIGHICANGNRSAGIHISSPGRWGRMVLSRRNCKLAGERAAERHDHLTPRLRTSIGKSLISVNKYAHERTSLRHQYRNDFVPMTPIDAKVRVKRDNCSARVDF